MTSDEARELFSAAYDDLLDEEDRAVFFAVLAEDDALSAEYDEFTELLGGASGLTSALTDELEVDLLAGVQTKLRQRSGGRFYRDRFSTTTGPGTTLPLALAVLMILMLAVAWAGLHFVQVESDAASSGAARE